jgi:ABC-2 type transport system permease protein
MVWHFVRLKVRLLANRLRTSSVVGALGFALIWVAGIGGGVLGGLGVFSLGRLTDEPGLILVIAYTAVFVGWMILPASFSALDETLDPRRFELLPLTPRQLTSGLLVAAAVTPGGLGTLIGLVIATVATAWSWSLAPLIVVAVVTELLLCLVVARLVTTFLSNLLSSRRARELVTLAFGMAFALLALIPAMLDSSDAEVGTDLEISLTTLEQFEILAWAPPGAVAQAVSRGSEGQMAASLGLLLYGIGATVVIGWAWSRAMRRQLVKVPSAGARARRSDDLDRALALTPGWLRLGSGPVLGVVSKELRYLVRDNRVRSQLLGAIIPVTIIAFLSRDSFGAAAYAPFLAVGAAFLVVFSILANQFGMDGGSFWGYVVSPAPLSQVVKGKNLGWGIVILAPVVLIAVGLAIWNGDYTYVVAAVLASIAVLLVATAIGNMTSIYGAFRIPEANPFGSRGFSGNVFIAVILSMMASGAFLLPLAALIGLPVVFLGPVQATVGALLGVGYGSLIYGLGMRLTSRLLVERRQSLLDVIDGEKV